MNRGDTRSEQDGRRSIRLREYDYSREGAYFITICTHQRQCVLGGLSGTEMILNELGEIVHQEWYRSAAMRGEIEPDAFIIMPNHVHGIILIHPVGASGCSPKDANGCSHKDANMCPPVGASGCSPKKDTNHIHRHSGNVGFAKRSLASFVAGFKAAVTTRINTLRGTPGQPFWQRNYYEHVIRSEASISECRKYIEENLLRLTLDKMETNTANIRKSK